MSAQDDLLGRYGTPAPWRRRVLLGGVGVLVACFAAWLTWATLYHAEPQAQSQLVGFDVVDEYTSTAVVDVDLADADVQARCRLRAYAEDHAVVGEIVFVPDPAAGPRYEESVRTEREATSVESLGCTTADQPRPR